VVEIKRPCRRLAPPQLVSLCRLASGSRDLKISLCEDAYSIETAMYVIFVGTKSSIFLKNLHRRF